MRKPPPSIKLYPAPRGFERIETDRYHVQAHTSRRDLVALEVLDGGAIRLTSVVENGTDEHPDESRAALSLAPGEAYALAQALIDASAYAAPLYVKPRIKVKAHA